MNEIVKTGQPLKWKSPPAPIETNDSEVDEVQNRMNKLLDL